MIRGEEGSISEIDKDTVAYHFHEPLGVVGQIIPFNFPLLMAAWKLAPALAAGNCTVIKPASPTPWSILKFAELIEDIVPPGVINIVNGPGAEIGKALATNKRIAKIAFTGETVTGRLIMQYAAQNIIPSTTELGGKSPNIFFADVMDADDEFLDKAIEGLVLYAFNKGEVCTCPSRALIEESIYETFMDRCLERIAAIRQGNPLDLATQIGAQVSTAQLEKIESYVQIGLDEGAELLIGGERNELDGELAGGYYYEPTVFKGTNKMRIFQEEIFGPVLAVTTFKDEAEALEIANDTMYGLGAGVWTRDTGRAYRMGRGIKAGRVWTNCYHLYPAHAAFGGYKVSGVGRENHKMMLDHYTPDQVPARQLQPEAAGAVLGAAAAAGRSFFPARRLLVTAARPRAMWRGRAALLRRVVLDREGNGAVWGTCTKVLERPPRFCEGEDRDLRPYRHLRRQRQERFAVCAGQVRDRADDPLAPEELVRKRGDVAHVDARADDGAALARARAARPGRARRPARR